MTRRRVRPTVRGSLDRARGKTVPDDTVYHRRSEGSEPYRFLDRALFWLEAATLAALILITLAQPRTSLVGIPTWGIVLLFAGYSLLADQIENRAHSLRALRWRYIADLPATALAYLLAGERGGPLFVLFILAVACAAGSMTLRGALLYAATVAGSMVFLDLVFLPSSPPTAGLSALSIRLVVLALMALGLALVMQRLLLEREAAWSAHGEQRPSRTRHQRA
jgi:hypothetical protein